MLVGTARRWISRTRLALRDHAAAATCYFDQGDRAGAIRGVARGALPRAVGHDHAMSKHLQRKSASPVSSDALASQAEEALRRERFKEAIELLKQLVKREARPEWRNALAEAYLGRAKALAAKGMFKEAEIVLGNAAAADGTVKEPLFLLHCLVRQGQFQKALAHALKYFGAAPGRDGPELPEVTAALYLAYPVGLAVSEYDQSTRATFVDAAAAARDVLKAWIAGKPADAIDPLLARIPMRSPFRAVRLIVKALLSAPDDPAKARRLLDGVAAESPFAPLRFAVEAALPGEPSELVGRWRLAGAAQQSFAIEMTSGSTADAQTLTRLLEAERGGTAALFAFLVKQAAHLPPAATRSACLNLLPHLPDRIGQFERVFGVLPIVEKDRILALAAEANGRWRRAEQHWRAVAAQFEQQGSRDAKLSAGVVFRHLADLAGKEDMIAGDGYQSEPVTYYLKKSLAADPDCLPALIQLIDLLQNGQDKEWRALAEQAARRFPDESAILLRAIESAAAGKAYKRAAGFAQRLLALDPINRPARQRMIDLQIAHARKQMRANRPDLAWQELIAAAQWERAGCPNAALRINQGLVAWRLGDADAEARLREGVDVAGDGVAGWLHAALQEVLLMTTPPSPVPIVHDELASRLRQAPEKRDIVAIVSAMAADDVRAAGKATAELVWRLRLWLQKATGIPFSPAEFHPVGDLLLRAQAFDVLRDYAVAGKRREPDEPVWRFYEILARTRNNPDWLHLGETTELVDMRDNAMRPGDHHWRNRIQQYLESAGDDPASKRRARRLAASAAADEDEAMAAMLGTILDSVSPHDVRRLIKTNGPDGAASALIDRLAKQPIGALLPRSALADVAKTLIEAVKSAASVI